MTTLIDRFNRSDSPDKTIQTALGLYWDQWLLSGGPNFFYIDSHEAHADSSSEVLAIHTRITATPDIRVTATTLGGINPSVHPVVRFIDKDNFYWLKTEPNPVHPDWKVRVYKRIDGFDTELSSGVFTIGGHFAQISLQVKEDKVLVTYGAPPITIPSTLITDTSIGLAYRAGMLSPLGTEQWTADWFCQYADVWSPYWDDFFPPIKELPVYLVADEDGEIHATVTNDVSAVPGVEEGDDGIITVTAPATATNLGDGVLLIEA